MLRTLSAESRPALLPTYGSVKRSTLRDLEVKHTVEERDLGSRRPSLEEPLLLELGGGELTEQPREPSMRVVAELLFADLPKILG